MKTNRGIRQRIQTAVKFVAVMCVFIGCSADSIQDLALAPNVNAFSILRGVITDTSIRMSQSRVMKSESAIDSSSQTSTAATTTTSSVIDPIEIGQVEILLVTESGQFLQRGSFPLRSDGSIPFQFEEENRDQPLRLRVRKETRDYEIALGKLEKKEFLELPELPLKEAALATRYLEQSHQYRDLRVMETSSFVQTLKKAIVNKVEPLTDELEELAEQIERVGVNEEGILVVHNPGYKPKNYIAPPSKRSWEASLLEPLKRSTPGLDTSTSTNPPVVDLPRKLVNLVQMVQIQEPGKVKLAYQDHYYGPERIVSLSADEFTVKVSFKNSLSLEERLNLLESGELLVEIRETRQRKKISLQDLSAEFQGTRLLEIPVSLREYFLPAQAQVSLYLEHSFPESDPREINLGFFKTTLNYLAEGS